MQYDVKTPTEYLEQLPNDWRGEKLRMLRDIVLGLSDDIEESINHKMLCFKIDGKVICHLNAQRHYVSLYVGNIATIDPTGTLLNGLNCGRSCVRLTKTKTIEDNVGLRQFVAQAYALARKGKDLAC